MVEPLSFKSLLIFFVSSTEIRTRIEKTIRALSRQEVVTGTNTLLKFLTEFVSSEQELFEKLETLLLNSRPSSVIVVSDQLTVASDNNGYQPSVLTRAIREAFLKRSHFCGLVALVFGAEHRTLDIDRLVAIKEWDVDRLRVAITKTATGLWMKSPPALPVLSDIDPGAMQVQAVQSKAELLKCLALRYQVYALMGYLAEDISDCKAALEMDSFDNNSIHFIATNASTGEIAGTARLVLQEVPRYAQESIIGMPFKTFDAHQSWCREIAVDVSEDVFLKRIEHPYFAPLPILQSTEFKESWPPILQEAAKGGELSRVVVAPPYRGLGVSRLLVRIVIATAVDLQKSFLLLECIPMHAQMYSHYGFELLEGHHCRAQELDQVAVGMRLDLQDTSLNRAVALARRDIQMVKRGRMDPNQLFGSKFLCQCRLKACWRHGVYESRGTKRCPLRSVFQECNV